MAGIWPGSTKSAVFLTFDMDGPSGMIYREPSIKKRPSPLSMGDFGPEVGTPRILETLSRYDIRATFFIPGWVAERHPSAVEMVAKAGHEVAHHGYMHEPPATLESATIEEELLDRGSEALRKVTGEKPVGYRSPAWDISEHTLKILAARGFIYDSSLMGDDVPYFVDVTTGRRMAASWPERTDIGRFAEQFDRLVEIPVHWSLDDAPYFPFNPAINRQGPNLGAQAMYEAWLWEFELAHENAGAVILTMHPYISGHWSRLNALERFIRQVFATPGADFFRCVDIAQHWLDRHSGDAGHQAPAKAKR